MADIIISGHATTQWDDRMPAQGTDPVTAWERGTDVDHVTSYFKDDDGNVADRVRLYHAVTPDGREYSAVLIARDNTLVTAYPYDGVADERVESYLDTMFRRALYYE